MYQSRFFSLRTRKIPLLFTHVLFANNQTGMDSIQARMVNINAQKREVRIL